ncbi:hypothetical protein OS493_000074 [Desmophyllum pertusum]|uniref:WSC domain-containing protein n=1 Tax=Desmophyllum pertusum TaxID=174260 RepID=A0A9X0DBC1_9CNID|nr:hypothetical protein OS493_000074 [Desmophyllum pertusum]
MQKVDDHREERGFSGDVDSCIEYVKVGCFRDSSRPLPELIEKRRPFNWGTPQESINRAVLLCAEEVSKKGFTIFGLQFYGECWSGENAAQTYDRDGRSDQCEMAVNNKLEPCNGDSDETCTGVGWTNYVYRITESMDGVFSAWSDWSPCSRSCGGGQRKRTRSCSNPRPSKCGKPCFGNTEESVDCNTHSCPVCEDKVGCKDYKELGFCDSAKFPGALYQEVRESCKKTCSRCP